MDAELVAYLDERFAYLDRRFGVIDQRFEAVDRRFDAMDRRFDAMERRQDATDARLQDTRRHLGVLIENLDGKIQLVAEGVIAVDQKIDRVHAELKAEIGEVKTLLTFSYTDLDRRVRGMEASGG
ncbi:MAG: hypothetical protein HYV92_03435 [Candidatus Rokubacteria bacterium]|nr:hypothetical protein [Candidatus Rokubacteria bacterium]